MKLGYSIVLGVIILIVAVWFVGSSWFPGAPVTGPLVFFVFVAPPVGTFWMMYMAIRHDARPLQIILLSFLPYTFLWYYFERVKPRKHLSRNRSL